MGSIMRYVIADMAHKVVLFREFPYGTFAVNVLGCFFIGLFGGLAETRQVLNHELRLFITLGILGGFTTFSAFGFETCALMRDGEALKAGLNVAVNVILGIGAVWLGHIVSRILLS